ncbi:MAG: Txe/YoeB family addiction module toxin [Bacteroidota bacterium]
MRELVFMPKAWKDLGWWFQNDIKTLNKIYLLLESCAKTPFSGIGQPEALKTNYSGYWSRRINLHHRIIYKVEVNRIVVQSLYGHYQD